VPGYLTQDIRNIALLGHAGSGKTSLAEALLFHSGAIKQQGAVEKGSTVCDFEAAEKELQHSIETALCHFDHKQARVNLLDTPGYPDFVNRSLAVLPAVETAAVVINAQNGIEFISKRTMEAAAERHLCRLIIINKIDAADTDLPTLLQQVQDTFGRECLPINLPAENGDRVIDCFFTPSDVTTDFSSISEAHDALVDQVVEVDEELMELYLEQEQSLDPEQLHDPFEQALRENHLIPVCFVSARTGAGIPELLDVMARLMPNPTEGNPPEFFKGEGHEQAVEVMPDSARHTIAHVFKVVINPFFGRLGMFRIHQGTVNVNGQLFIGDGRKPFKVAHLYTMQGKQQEEIRRGIPGDICTVTKVDEILRDVVLHDHHDEDLFHLRAMNFPAAMFGLAVKTARLGDEQKLSEALHKLEAEDPALTVEHRANLDETVLRGASELHLRTVLEKMQSQYNVAVDTSTPGIAYRETITRAADGHARHKKQTGGAGQFGEVYLKVEPLQRGQGYEFVNSVVGGSIPSQYIPAVEKGIHQVLESGAVAGFPLQDIRVNVYDGKHHSVDSKEVAFVAAGKKALIDAIKSAAPIILEPVVDLVVTAPGTSMGDISGDLSSMRGLITGTKTMSNNFIEISSKVPLGELDNYQTRLNSETGGEGSFTVEFSHYDPVPSKLQQTLQSQFKHADEDD
jgi:elongation factor G